MNTRSVDSLQNSPTKYSCTRSQPYFLSAATAAAQARYAFEQDALGFQNGRHDCSYHYDMPGSGGRSVVCALGAALPRDVVIEGLDIGALIALDLVATDDIQALKLLQSLHDCACVSGKAEDIQTFAQLLNTFDRELPLAA